MSSLTRFLAFLLLALACAAAAPAGAQQPSSQQADVQTTWRLLDYVAVDYAGAVQGGRVVNTAEYAEMSEFSASVRERIAGLPANSAKSALLAQADRLRQAVGAKAAPEEIARIARALGGDLIGAYPVPLAPRSAPDLARGAALYQANCAACHGTTGNGRGPMAATLDPKPIDFTDRARASQRSPFALYQVIEQGLEGTAMPSFANLPAEDRWALAFHVGRYAFPPELAAQGERIWRSDASVRESIPDLTALAALTPAALAARVGPEKAAALTAYLRGNPAAVSESEGAPLDIARSRLRQSLAAYQAGHRDEARDLALAAYLEGFEPIEPMLATRDGGLLRRVEVAMGELRAAIGSNRPAAEVEQRMTALGGLFDEAQAAIAPGEASPLSSFLGGFIILAREGLEALLIVIAMIVFLQRAERRDVLPYVHGGWIVALLAGIATWWAATHLITISGASREMTEGIGSIFAAVVLLFVGIWMHGKAQANEWQRYIHEKLGKALSRGSAWFLFILAFVAVYREVFETILFYAALSADGNGAALAAGAGAAALLLGIVGWAMIRYSRRLPITQFFSWSSILIAVLAVVLTGKGVAALQEAGMIGVTPLGGVPTVSMLGVHPSMEVLGAQLLVLVILLAGFARNRRHGASLAPAAA